MNMNVRELIQEFQYAVSHDLSAIEGILNELTKTEEGERAIKMTVRSTINGKLVKEQLMIVEKYIIPFCKENKINITKKHLKTLL